ncbi:DUF4838 domain-containing protein, partial [Ruficoccus amylovorans]
QEVIAADMLKEGLDSMSGATFNIIPEPLYAEEFRSMPVLSVGNTKLKEASGLLVPELSAEGYALQASGNALFFTGGERRGPINAVIAFLEEDLGCRWYSRFVPAYYPYEEELTVSVVPRSYSPILEMRDVYHVEAQDPDWAIMNRISSAVDPLSLEIPSAYGGMLRYPGRQLFAHTFYRLAPAKELLSSHPEYFALINGERQFNNICLSNEEALRIVADNAIKILDADPDARLFSISQNDGSSVLCRCEDCLAFSEKENDSGLLINFVNQVAELIHRKYPDVQISTLAYLQTFMPPKTIRPDGDTLIWLATDRHVWHNKYFYITETEEFQEALESWRAIGAKIHIWDYTFGDNANWLTPIPNFKVIEENFKYLVEQGISGIFFQDNFLSIGGSRATMKDWALAKLAWDPTLEMDDLLRDFTFGYYGAAGPSIWKYNQLLHQEWESFHRSNRPNQGAVLHLDRAFINEALALIDQAKAAVINDPVLLAEVEREETCLLYARLENGVTNLADKKAYLEDMDQFRKYVEKFEIKSFAEPTLTDTTTKFTQWRIGMNLFGKENCSPSVIELQIKDVLLPKVGAATCRLTEEPLSDSGYAVYQPGMSTNWSIQWDRSAIDDYRTTETYVLQLRVKLGDLTGSGSVLMCGVWDPEVGSLLEREIDSSELSQDEFSWVTVGEVKLPASSSWTIYAGAAKDSVADYFLLECAELVPESELEGGVSNLNPASTHPVLEMADGHATFSFCRERFATNLTYVVEVSSDLTSWTEIWSSANVPYGGGISPVERITVQDPVRDASLRFLRLKITE